MENNIEFLKGVVENINKKISIELDWNTRMSQDDTPKKVTIKGNTTTAEQASDYKKDYKTGSTYSVTVTKNTKGGLISEITIAENQ